MDESLARRPAHSTGISQGVRTAAAVASIPALLVINIAARSVTDVETAALIAGAIPGAAIAGLEYLAWKRQPSVDRIRAAVEGSFYKSPLLVAVYVVLAIQTVQSIIGFLVGFAIGTALQDYDLPRDDVSQIAITAAAIVIVPLVAVAIVLIARFAAYRIREHPLAWIALALVANIGLNLIQSFVVIGADEFTLGTLDVIGIAILNLFYFGAAAIGVRWAQRTQALHVLTRAYRSLPPADRAVLVELALPKIESRNS